MIGILMMVVGAACFIGCLVVVVRVDRERMQLHRDYVDGVKIAPFMTPEGTKWIATWPEPDRKIFSVSADSYDEALRRVEEFRIDNDCNHIRLMVYKLDRAVLEPRRR